MIGIVRVEIPAPRIDVDIVVSGSPARITVPLGDQAVGVAIRLKSILSLRTPAGSDSDESQYNEHRPG
jgi:hypothetical protein